MPRYDSKRLNRGVDGDFAAVVVTREGLEVAAQSNNLRLEYANTWDSINEGLKSLGAKIRGEPAEEFPELEGEVSPSMEVH